MVTLSDQGVLWETQFQRTETRWTYYDRYVEAPAVFILIISRYKLEVLPKRAITAEEIVRLRVLFFTNVGNAQGFHAGKAQGFPVVPAK